MGLFSKKSTSTDGSAFRGGCSDHDMRGPVRRTFREANKDANAHSKRMHGGKNPHGYVQGGK
ncbi:hypothetical protein [Micromonospora sp. NPDC023644]|uniref:hypothetical protein n=1 Tax=Micromonospora sp. NPDC023644 TaxID=3154321 RepID=UPI0033D6EF28